LVVQNTGSGALTLSTVQVGGVAASSVTINPAALEPGDSSTIVVTQAFTSGVKYEFAVITAKGNTFGPYIKTAP
jgi:P pilus assembly chaperone PapD